MDRFPAAFAIETADLRPMLLSSDIRLAAAAYKINERLRVIVHLGKFASFRPNF
jgi:hypothetical protein